MSYTYQSEARGSAITDEVSDAREDGREGSRSGDDPTALLVPAQHFPELSLTIVSIEWERVWVTLDLEFSAAPQGDVDFMLYDMLRAFPVDAERVSDTAYRIQINVTNFRNRQQVPNGSWRFMAVIDTRRGPIAGFPLSRASDLASFGRSYLYNQNRSTYVVAFGFSKDDRADVIMRTYQLNRPAPKVAKAPKASKPANSTSQPNAK